MKLFAEIIPYSSIVGGGLTLIDEQGRARFIVMFRGTTAGISKEETGLLANWFLGRIEEYGGLDMLDEEKQI